MTLDSNPKSSVAEETKELEGNITITEKTSQLGEESMLTTKIEANEPLVEMSKLKQILLFIGLLLGVSLSALNMTIVVTALPEIANEFASLDKITWVAIADLITATSFEPIYGKLSDIFGRRATLLSAILIFELGSLLSALSKDIMWLILARGVSGIGSGGFIGLTTIIVADIVKEKDRGIYMGIIGAAFAIASILGPLFGGLFTDYVTWRWAFYINLPIGGVSIILIALFLNVPLPPISLSQKLRRVDWWGTLLIISSTILICVPLESGGIMYSWNSPMIITLLIAGFLGFCGFIYVERFVSIEPIAPARLFRNRTVIACFVMNFMYNIGIYEFIFYTPLFFQLFFGDTATISGVKLLAYSIGAIISALMSGILISRANMISYKMVCVFGGMLITIGSGFTISLNENSPLGAQVGYLMLSGLGMGSIFLTTLLAGQAAVEPRDIAAVTSLMTFFRSLGSVIGLTIFGSIFNNELLVNLRKIFPNINFAQLHGDISTLLHLPAFIKDPILNSFLQALHHVFLAGTVAAGLLFLAALSMKSDNISSRRKSKLANLY